jgi:hypothetical protein
MLASTSASELSVSIDEGRESRTGYFVQRDRLTETGRDRRFDHDVTWALAAEHFGEGWDRINRDPSPAMVVEGTRHRFVGRVSRSNIDVAAVDDIPERSPQHDVLAILRERFERDTRHSAPRKCHQDRTVNSSSPW